MNFSIVVLEVWGGHVRSCYALLLVLLHLVKTEIVVIWIMIVVRISESLVTRDLAL